ncbi:maltose ABC transporter permease MalF [Reinekea blandensis]|uniref:Maltose/maltodextrin transport system permease protein n=1 Tax=Reinekea blandensis MED297 TaxID=314283 RepID=A4B998_9GAMM|nr:maltose ABC transporter permease MalF [Reinekea blandensis]EAR11199.1 inner membrane permease of maltose ABC transporter [Reinekea sp. MED297] [Reinekea blandensis MED297]
MANPNAIPMVPAAAAQEKWKTWLQYIIVGALTVFFSYVTLLMYAQGEVLYGSLIMVFTAVFTFIFLSERAYVWRYVFPGLIGVFAFVIFPIMYTLGLTFTNKSNLHLLSFDQAKSYFLDQTYIADGAQSYEIGLYEEGSAYRVVLESEQGTLFITENALPLTHVEPISERLTEIQSEPDLPQAERRATITYRNELDSLQLVLPDGTVLAKSKLREYSQNYPLWTENPDDPHQLTNQKDGTVLNASFEDGFFYDSEGEYYTPGFQVNIGFDNYVRVLTEDGMLAPFLQIFTWTMFFAIFTVVVTFFIGMTLASFVQWEPIKGRGIYQVLLILPYAVPSFILIMIFRALFNQNFGQINYVLELLFNISPEWNSDPNFTRTMILIVNLFLGYPYMFILSLGMLQSIPKDLYEASSLEGAGPLVNFFKITLPLVLRPMLPLMIASFAFNFNNFVLIQLLTRGGPIIIGSNPQAGETDLLVNYAFRLAFMGDTRDFALGATVSTFIFMMVGLFAVAYLKAAKIEVGIKK